VSNASSQITACQLLQYVYYYASSKVTMLQLLRVWLCIKHNYYVTSTELLRVKPNYFMSITMCIIMHQVKLPCDNHYVWLWITQNYYVTSTELLRDKQNYYVSITMCIIIHQVTLPCDNYCVYDYEFSKITMWQALNYYVTSKIAMCQSKLLCIKHDYCVSNTITIYQAKLLRIKQDYSVSTTAWHIVAVLDT